VSKKSIKVNCHSCNGTGIYCGFMERPGEGVVCVTCSGRGYEVLKGTQFVERKRRGGVTKVRVGSGMILDDTSKINWMSYEEFQKRY